ncbi:DEAD/DEAH box helicase [Nocardia sp. NPDC057227]|uniref:DEAD/DEAH box helicase n=1 Tax=Nocardia sp. NPDC057227 TaxID=3346056 RepID=UPI0036295AED
MESRIRALLRTEGSMSARALTEAIDDPACTRTMINSLLHARQDIFSKSDDTPPIWSIRRVANAVDATAEPDAGTSAGGRTGNGKSADASRTTQSRLRLHTWQKQTLAGWRNRGHRGIVEAVDGAGKTVLGIAAAAEAVEAGHQVAILVPDADQQRRWLDALRNMLHNNSIDGSGGAAGRLPAHGDITVVTAYAAIRDRLIDRYTQHRPTALIVDDVHGYSAGAYAKALLPLFQWRLALTCGAERGDDLIRTVVRPYFGEIIPGCDYPHAVHNGLLPRIALVQVPVRFTASEDRAFRAADDRAERALDTLVGTYGAPDVPAAAEEFARAQVDGRGPAAVPAKRYLEAIGKRAEVLGGSQEKLAALRALPVPVLAGTQTIFFTDRTATATRLVQALGRADFQIARVGADVSAVARDEIARRLRERGLHAVVEHRGLDPVLTVPHVGMGVFVTPDLTERQLAHRLGRVIRPGAARAPVILLVYVENSAEDPRRAGAHIRKLRQIAAEEVTVGAGELPGLLTRLFPAPDPAEPHPVTPSPAPPPAAPSPAPRPVAPSPRTEPGRPTPRSMPGIRRTDRPKPEPTAPAPEPVPAPTEPEAAPVTTELTDQLHAQGGIATADEIGDLIGLTDPRAMTTAVTAAAAAGILDFRPISDDAEELVLLAAAAGGTAAQRGAALDLVTEWAVRAADPIEDFPRVVRALAPLRVPHHRLIGVAAFLRGTTPAGLL